MYRYRPIKGTQIIGFGYKARHGKDLAARTIVRRAGLDAHIFNFSDPISAYCRVACGMKERNPHILQQVGLASRRTNENIWVDAVYGSIQDRCPELALVSGVRFPNEAEMIRATGGFVVHIQRLSEDGSAFVSEDRDPDHDTETALDGFDFDYKIVNRTGQQDRFIQDVLAMFRVLTGRETK